jgi:hypothetical protein
MVAALNGPAQSTLVAWRNRVFRIGPRGGDGERALLARVAAGLVEVIAVRVSIDPNNGRNPDLHAGANQEQRL